MHNKLLQIEWLEATFYYPSQFEAKIWEGLSWAVPAQDLLGGCSEMITRAQMSGGQRSGGRPASLALHGVSGSLHVVFPCLV